MNAIKTKYDKIPETITVPGEFVNKKGKVIILLDDEKQSQKHIVDFYGIVPDFPERDEQGEYEKRADL